MASKLLPYSLLSLLTLSGFNYTTHYQRPHADNPYILFIHGFPSSAYDWRHQVDYFANLGYGIIAPDTLGYGDTSKPLDIPSYKVKAIGDSLIEVVDKVAGKNAKVIGVGHDWGSAILSRLANFHADRFLSYSFLAGGYSTPSPFDLDEINAETQALLGYSTLGYFKFFNQSDAGPIIDSHQESFADLIYPPNMTVWRDYLGPLNKTEPWLLANTRVPHAPYVSDQEFRTHEDIFSVRNGGYTPALGYYRAVIRQFDAADNLVASTSRYNTTKLPTLFIGGTTDPLTILPLENQATQAFAPGAQLADVTAGHWVHLEQANAVNSILKDFFKKCIGGRTSYE